ncbi:MAG: FG-GAP-like repeat-containing protein [Terriglobales bacterium]
MVNDRQLTFELFCCTGSHHVRHWKHRDYRIACVLVLLAAVLSTNLGCHSAPKLPETSTKEYGDVVSAFYVGLVALQVGDDVHADSKLAEVTRLVPGEPAGWANWGILALRQRNYDPAAQRLERARDLAPQNDRIYDLLGILESQRGDPAHAIADLRKAVELNPKNLRALYQLAEETERQGDESGAGEVQQLLQKILSAQPDNLAALLELSRIAAKRGDAATLKSAVAQISARSSAWPPEVQHQLAAVQSATAGADLRPAATQTTFLRNVMMRVPEYRQSLAAIKAPPGDEAEPFTHFLKLESPVFRPAPADTALSFNLQPIANTGNARWNWIGAISLGSAGAPVVVLANAREVHLATGATFPFPGASGVLPLPEGVVPIDFNYDFKTDLVLAGAGGVRLMRQDNPSAFTDVSAAAKLPKSVANAPYTGAWAVDIEADGDLDIVLGAKAGAPTVLRNNGDGTFLPIHPFDGVSGVSGFAWADLDGDGNPDAAIIDGAGRLHVFMNLRQGQFKERPLPPGLTFVKAVAVADANNDGILDLLAVQADGAVLRISDKNEGQSWETAEIARVPSATSYLAGEVRLHVADLDNNGAFDLILSPTAPAAGGNNPGAMIWLGDVTGSFTLLTHPAGPALVFDAADTGNDGHLDLLGLSADGQPMQGINQSPKNYHWQVVRPHAVQAVGDQRINPFGVGGEIEIRAGLLVQKQPITGPQLHFGLGDRTRTDVVRVLWPNGTVRAEFEMKADQDIVTEQRIKGSCPYLFAYNGKQVEFVKDAVPWSSAIGLRINTLGTARVEATEEWYKIPSKQLAPHDGFYDLRITAELWETYYYDYMALMTVDHPAGTDIFVDERFVIPTAKLAITSVATPHAIARAVDDTGTDVTEVVKALDGKYLDTFGRGQYQGVTRDHYVEVDLGDDAPTSGPLYLIASGWMHPTDSSINVAISEGHHVQARGLSLEVPDGRGGWIVAESNLGFPAGRKKICLFDLTHVFRPGTPRRVRLRTNLEVYWDRIEWAKGLPDTSLKITRLDPATADLHYRGYSVMNQANPSSPELPDYNHIEGSTQRWRDLVGYYTRFGDVRELLKNIDDRYVIMNSGDEMTFRFAEQPPPATGWVRDFVIVGDGWIKDGDYNSTFSKTVLPLPYHAKNEYTTPPGRLEDEWAYRHHPEDWQTYHTRYVTPDVFNHVLRSGLPGSGPNQ